MSIQILGLRPYTDKKTGKIRNIEWGFDQNWRAASVIELFATHQKILDTIPKDQHFNLYYTIHNCPEGPGGKGRKFTEQWAMPFDIDGIDVKRWRDYPPVVAQALGVDLKSCGVIFSGNGIQFIIGLSKPIESETYFNRFRPHYRATCEKINRSLLAEGLPGGADPMVFSPKRLMRFPNTKNIKKDKPERMGEVFNSTISKIDFDITKISGLPLVSATEQITPEALKKFPSPDTPSVLDGCDFLKHCKGNPGELNEGQWYAMLSITGRLTEGTKISHEYSEGHPGYSHSETEMKLEQALQASGPRTCKNINDTWGGCKDCPNFENINSPIMIRGKDYIATKDTGFHKVVLNSKGEAKTGPPCYLDLQRYFEQETPYVVLGESKVCLTFNGKYWEVIPDVYLENFAQRNFNPYANTNMTKEFKNLVCRSNLKKVDWFVESTNGKINFQNGFLDLKSMKFKPHSDKIGFRYVLPYNFDPKAKCKRFDQFMDEVTGSDNALKDILLEFAGYAFSNDICWTEKALIMTGDGANGKSTFMNVLRALAGTENYASLLLSDLKNEASRYQLDGKLFNLSEETPRYSVNESSLFKTLITGGEIMVKVLYKQTYKIRNKCKLILACNELPYTPDTSKGFFRRLLIVPFTQTFEGDSKDSFIFDKMKVELPGIFNRVIAGYHRVSKNQRFTESEKVNNEINEYMVELDSVRHWFFDSVKLHNPENTEHNAILSKFYSAYRYYSESHSEKPVVYNTFCKRLSKLIPKYNKRKQRIVIDSKNETILSGVEFGDGSAY